MKKERMRQDVIEIEKRLRVSGFSIQFINARL